ncbi:efflux transporter outer membrane subunit [Coralloluteibacterium stylophorae]|nr:efflux transporter outer membrane subunit [Coralloluteibacterium stylophorae]
MRPRRVLPLAALAACVLSGCVSMGGLAPGGRVHDADALATAASFAAVRVSPGAWPRRDWWTDLEAPALDGLIVEALQGNPDLDLAAARVRQAQARAAAADAARLPTLGANAGLATVHLPESLVPAPIGGSTETSAMVRLDANWEADLWGGQRAAYAAAVGSARAAEIDANAARLTLSVQVASAYAELAQAGTDRRIATAELERAQHTLSLVDQRVQAGIDSRLQLRRAEAAVPAARQEIEAANQRIDAARNALAALLGAGPDRGQAIALPEPLSPLDLALPSTLPSDLLARRPDLVAARWRVEAADRGVEAARTEFYPSFNVMAIVGSVAGSAGDLFTAASGLGLATPGFSLPLFDGGRLRANLDAADADYDLAVADYNSRVVAALREVADRVSAIRSLDVQAVQQADAVAAARSAYDLAQQRYGGGVGNLLDALDAQAVLFQTERRAAAIDAQRIEASIGLVQALGGGFDPADAGDLATLASSTSSPQPAADAAAQTD